MKLKSAWRGLLNAARGSGYGMGVLLIVHAFATNVLASGPIAVPEIDGSSISAGLGLLTAGVLIVRSRWGSRSK
jgi:hypothetical protein